MIHVKKTFSHFVEEFMYKTVLFCSRDGKNIYKQMNTFWRASYVQVLDSFAHDLNSESK